MDARAAQAKFGEWEVGANALSLLGAAQRCGLLDGLREGHTAAEAAMGLGLDATQVGRVCMALEALGVLRRRGPAYVLTDGWRTLTAPDQPGLLGPAPGLEGVDPEEVVAVSDSVWGVPRSSEVERSWTGLDASMPEVRDAWRAGARHAEFGCGAGRHLLRVVAMYPRVTAVGYDVLPHGLAPARELATALGLGARVEFRMEDTAELTLVDEFDTILWCQMFFSGAVRAATIDNIRRALKPGGYLVMPLMPDLPSLEQVEITPAERSTLLLSVACPRWNVQWPVGREVRRELEQAGFEHLHTLQHGSTPFMVMRLPA
ncbi:MAG: class I SAM-dependent methyltransferase [Deinococcales bacterium]